MTSKRRGGDSGSHSGDRGSGSHGKSRGGGDRGNGAGLGTSQAAAEPVAKTGVVSAASDTENAASESDLGSAADAEALAAPVGGLGAAGIAGAAAEVAAKQADQGMLPFRRICRVTWISALIVGMLHYWEVVCYHSELNNLSPEEQTVAALRTECAFYYSYYAEAVAAPTWTAAVWSAFRDRRSEAPDTINALYRFNVYQELFCGLICRFLRWIVGEQWLPHPWYVYRHCCYLLQGAGHASLVLMAASCGGYGVRGAALPAAALIIMMFLHRRTTMRIHDEGMLTLREHWAMPLINCQILALHRMLIGHPALGGIGGRNWSRWRWVFRCCTVLSILAWQFSAFAFLLQVSAVFLCALLACSLGARRALEDVVLDHLGCVAVSAAFLFGNELLVHHMLVTQCVAIWTVLRLRGPPRSWLLFWIDGVLAVALFGGARVLQSRWATAEEHIGELFTAKLGQLLPNVFPEQGKNPTFNARLYMAVSVFDFMDWQTVKSLVGTGLLHFSAVGAISWFLAFLWHVVFSTPPTWPEVDKQLKATKEAVENKEAAAHEAAQGVVQEAAEDGVGDMLQESTYAMAFGYGFLLTQLAFFAALGGFISRLKVLAAPQLVVLAATVFTPLPLRFASSLSTSCAVRPRVYFRTAICRKVGVVISAALALSQVGQIGFLASRMPFLEGTWETFHREMHWAYGDTGELFDWMNQRLPSNATIVTSMVLSAEIRLSTPFRVVIHPQFEAQSLRDRVQHVYELYQCTSPEHYAKTMRSYGASYLVLEYRRCSFSPFLLDTHPGLNCKEGERPWKDLFCARAHGSSVFDMLFANSGFVVFQVRGKSERKGHTSSPITELSAWKPMLNRCRREEPDVCGGRIAELATMFHEKLGQHGIGRVLLDWVTQHFPDDGIARYVVGRHFDYNLQSQDEAAIHYRRAYELMPNHPIIVREYLMWLDVLRHDNRSVEALLRPRRFGVGTSGRKSLLDLADDNLACEAAPPARDLFHDHDWARELWELAKSKGIASNCVKNNWALFERVPDIRQDIGDWGIFVNVFWRGGPKSYLTGTSSTGIRFQAPRKPWRIGVEESFVSY
eukprot:TRINITY_DN12582_c0_g2_i1.p1 TRINITY_DN12582_c0_g2~~TRINITY_DN12582_c0_g2_i1.p1  ORF type:complete len:1076 (+),score=144.74 TRINITY_DN12582_c0_g2_i1:77-3304(+)